jgi:hypothetical protein
LPTSRTDELADYSDEASSGRQRQDRISLHPPPGLTRLSTPSGIAGGWHEACSTPCKDTARRTAMIELEPGNTLDISLKEDGQGRDRVELTLQAHACTLTLTPHQARVLATELIMAVNRAEVRSNLKHSQNMVRETQPGPQKRGLLHQAFAK